MTIHDFIKEKVRREIDVWIFGIVNCKILKWDGMLMTCCQMLEGWEVRVDRFAPWKPNALEVLLDLSIRIYCRHVARQMSTEVERQAS